ACACVVQRDPVVPALYESRPVFDVLKDVAGKLELGEYFDFTIEEYRKQQLRELPGAAEAFKKDGVYYNPSKVYGIYEDRNRFRMVVGRSASVTQTSSQNNTVLHQLTGPNTLWLNTKAAHKLGIKSGDLVEVASSVGKGELKVEITDG
ncbi:molybdopterin oxidoreductase, partial [Aduncisulcus paluster]